MRREGKWTWPRIIIAGGATAWTAYKLIARRNRWSPGGTATAADGGTEGVIPPEPWDIGTGVTGYVWHAPEARAAVLLQHGFGEHAQRFTRQYSHLIPHLLELGISVYAFDMWGHGHSPGVRGLVNIGQAVEDHLAARRSLRGQPLPLFLLGHSLGGLVTATSVLRDGSRLQGVILSAPALLYEEPKALHLATKAGAFLAPTVPVPTQKIEPATLYRGAESDPLYMDDPLIYRGSPRMQVASTTLETSTRNWDRYVDWRVPVLAFHGTDDTVTDPRGSERLIEAVSANDKTLHLVEGGYHELLNDIDCESTLSVVLDWLEQRIASG
jgi:acylglycerol lipase